MENKNLINYLAASWRGIVRNNILIEKPMVSQTLPYKETSEQAHEGIRINKNLLFYGY